MKHEKALPDSEVLASFGAELEPKETEDLVQGHLEGAGYWNLRNPDGSVNVEEKTKWQGIVNHILLEYNLSIVIAKRLKEIGEKKLRDEGDSPEAQALADINLTDVANGSLISDIAKGRSDKDRKKEGNPDEDTHSPLGYEMGKQIGLPEHVARIAITHHFPTSEEQLPTWLDKIIFCADVMTSQRYMTVEERLHDVETRWITQRLQQGLQPLVDPIEFAKNREVAYKIRDEVFAVLGVTNEQEFLASIPHLREERYLRALYERNMETRGVDFANRLKTIGK